MSQEKKLERNKSDDILLAILYVLEKEANNKNNALTNAEIIRRITEDEVFKDNIENKKSLRNTVHDKLKNIENFYDRKLNEKLKKEGTKYYLDNNSSKLTFIDIQMLIDDVVFSKMRSPEEVKRLTKLLKQQTTKKNQKKLNYSDYVPEKQYTLNLEIKENIKIVREAIQNNRINYNKKNDKNIWLEISFNTYSKDKHLHKKTENGRVKKYIIYPIDVVEAYNNYYLICVMEDNNDYSHFRIDLMTDMHIKNSKKVPESLVAKWMNEERRNLSKYLSEHLYMSYRKKGDNARDITLRIKKGVNEEVANLTFLHDHFGSNWEVEKDDDDYIEVKVKCLTYSITLFVREYMDFVKVIKPLEVKKEVEKSLRQSFDNYFTDDY